LLQGQGDSGMDSLGVHARRQHGIGEIHGRRLLTYEQNTRHLTLPRGFASFAATAEAHKATRVQKWRVLADCTIPPFDRRVLFKVGMVEIGGRAELRPYFVDRPVPP
jgi:hypothetical protein